MGLPGERIKQRRQKLQLSQQDLAKLIGTTQNQISKYELSRQDPSSSVLIALAHNLNTSVDWLLGLSEIEDDYLWRSGLNEQEMHLVELYRVKSREDRDKIMRMLEVM